MILLDTNVISETMRPEPDQNVISWLNDQSLETLYLSSVTTAELLFGVAAVPVGARQKRLQNTLDDLFKLFKGRILPFDKDAAQHYASLALAAQRAGRPLTKADGFIAATAGARGFAVATRDAKHFEATRIKLIDPWQES
jgi:predicted nucleic acid-binding protein